MGKRAEIVVNLETKYGLNVFVKKPHNRYLDMFLNLKCAPDLILSRVFPDAKEITESFGAYAAFTKYLSKSTGFTDVVFIVLGDGSTPRTGATFAMRTAGEVLSVDPNLKRVPSMLKRLHCYKASAPDVFSMVNFQEKILLKKVKSGGKLSLIFVSVHGHLPGTIIKDIYKLAKDFDCQAHVIDIPCCKPKTFALETVKIMLDNMGVDFISYTDWGIHSPEREVRVIRNLIGGLG